MYILINLTNSMINQQKKKHDRLRAAAAVTSKRRRRVAYIAVAVNYSL